MTRLVRRFYKYRNNITIGTMESNVTKLLSDVLLDEWFEEADPTTATHSADMALTDDGKIIPGTIQVSHRKRYPEEIHDLGGTLWRVTSKTEIENFQKFHNRDRA